jgi:hypothetical protein
MYKEANIKQRRAAGAHGLQANETSLSVKPRPSTVPCRPIVAARHNALRRVNACESARLARAAVHMRLCTAAARTAKSVQPKRCMQARSVLFPLVWKAHEPCIAPGSVKTLQFAATLTGPPTLTRPFTQRNIISNDTATLCRVDALIQPILHDCTPANTDTVALILRAVPREHPIASLDCTVPSVWRCSWGWHSAGRCR